MSWLNIQYESNLRKNDKRDGMKALEMAWRRVSGSSNFPQPGQFLLFAIDRQNGLVIIGERRPLLLV